MIPPVQAIFISGPGCSNITQRYPTDKSLPKYQVNQLHCLLDRNLSSGQCDPSSEQQGHSGIFNSCTRTNGRKNEISIPEISRKTFVGLSSFFSLFISFTNLRYFSSVGGFVNVTLQMQGGSLESPPPRWSLISALRCSRDQIY